MKKISLLLCSILLLGLLCGCAPERYTAYTFAFDTEITLTAYCQSEEEFQALKSLLFGRMQELHRKFDIYHAYEGMNNLYTVNQSAGQPVPVDGEILELLAFGQELYGRTEGLVNIAMGSMLRLWKDARDAGALPEPSALEAAAAHGNMENLLLDAQQGTVTLLDAEMALDVGAIAKGWSAQKAAEDADAAGYSNFALSAGGNVITRGRAGERLWRVGIRDPQSADASAQVCSVETENMALVTSGGYERSLTVDGKTYCHIIDPFTGYPADRMLSATVICADSGLADGLSTALFLMEPQQALDFAREQGVRAIIVAKNGTLLDTEAQ